MASYDGFFLLDAGVALFLIAWFGKSRMSLHPISIAAMIIIAGLAILQILGTDAPIY